MNPLGDLGKGLMVLGGALLLVGACLLLGGRLPWLGRLPGDMVIEKKQFHFYFPLGTCLLISLLLSLLFSLFGRR